MAKKKRVETSVVEKAPARRPATSPPGPLPTGDTFRHYLQQVMKYPRLTREEEHELALRYREYGDPEAAYRLVTGNLRLVVSIAFEYRRAFLNLLDLVQEGNIGLMQAVKKYDPLRGVPFSSYAAWWIRAYILKHLLDHWSIVKVGTTNARRKLFFNLRKEKERLEREGITAGPKLLAEAFETTEADVIDVSRALSSRDLSLDAPVAADSERRVWETLPVGGPPLEDSVAQEELREILREKLARFAERLNAKERFTLERRLVAEDPLTLQQIGDQFGITREAARLIEKKVIGRLRDYLRGELKDLRLFEVADDPGHKPESPAALDYRAGKKGPTAEQTRRALEAAARALPREDAD
ncbi:MAG TPA: sigma-70 family RNA polymerase sigma factor [Candidatus Polarisedimenticolia bacterium]|nr:sigma-70 family RNA polymerase sigma factor [Candidatus Polarisedimenticolia bacterium]